MQSTFLCTFSLVLPLPFHCLLRSTHESVDIQNHTHTPTTITTASLQGSTHYQGITIVTNHANTAQHPGTACACPLVNPVPLRHRIEERRDPILFCTYWLQIYRLYYSNVKSMQLASYSAYTANKCTCHVQCKHHTAQVSMNEASLQYKRWHVMLLLLLWNLTASNFIRSVVCLPAQVVSNQCLYLFGHHLLRERQW